MFKLTQKTHRVVGVFSVAIILFLTITGLLLEHREGLRLYERYPTSSIVHWLYGTDGSAIGDEYSQEPPSWERVLTAFHGGKFFGKSIGLFMDLAGVIFLFLAATGLYLWIKRILLLRKDNRPLEDEILIQKAEQLIKIQTSTKGLIKRAGNIHDLSEHVMSHIRSAPDGEFSRDVGEIERHLNGLDGSMHKLIARLESLENDAIQE